MNIDQFPRTKLIINDILSPMDDSAAEPFSTKPFDQLYFDRFTADHGWDESTLLEIEAALAPLTDEEFAKYREFDAVDLADEDAVTPLEGATSYFTSILDWSRDNPADNSVQVVESGKVADELLDDISIDHNSIQDSRATAAAQMAEFKGEDAQPQYFQIDETLTRGSQKADSFDSLFETAIGPLALLSPDQESLEIRFKQVTAVRRVNDLEADKIAVLPDRTFEQIQNQVAFASFKRQWKLITGVFTHMLKTGASLVDIDAVLPDDIDYRPYFESSEVNLQAASGHVKKAEIFKAWLEVTVSKMAQKSGYLEAHEEAFTLAGQEGPEYTPPTVSVLIPYGSLIGNYLFEKPSIEIDLEDGKKITVNFHPVPMMGDHDYFAIFHAGDQKDVNLQRVYSMGVLARRPSQGALHGTDESADDRFVMAPLAAEFFPINPVIHHFKIDERL